MGTLKREEFTQICKAKSVTSLWHGFPCPERPLKKLSLGGIPGSRAPGPGAECSRLCPSVRPPPPPALCRGSRLARLGSSARQMRGAWSRPPAPRASRPRRPRVGGRDQRELPGRAQHLRKLAEMFENEKSNRLSASALPITLQPRHILDKRCFFYQQSDDGEDGDGGVYGWSKLAGHVPSPLYLKLLFLVFNPESIIPVLLPVSDGWVVTFLLQQ